MVLHAGISCYKQKLAIYNTETREQSMFDIQHVGPNDFNAVEQLFSNIKPHFTAPLGCLCICLGSSYDSDIRQKFIYFGRGFGFTNISITDWLSALYSNLVYQTNFKPQKGYLILIFCGQICHIWFKGFKKAKFIKELKYYDTVESLIHIQKFISNQNFVKNQSLLIIYGTRYRTQNIKSIFGNSTKIHFYKYLNQVNGALVKARIMAEDKNLMEYDAQQLLERDITIRIGNKIIMEINKWHLLPFFEEKMVHEIVGGKTMLTITSNFNVSQKPLPNSAKFNIKFAIDTNGISSISLIPEFNDKSPYHQNAEKKIDPFNNRVHELIPEITYDISNLISRQFRKHYFLPKRIQNNDENIFAVGIDLGTSRCCAAVNRRSGIETVPLDNLGERLLPSYVGFDEVNEKCGQIVINRLAHYSKSTVFDAKRIIGKRFEDIKIDGNWTFKVLNNYNKIHIQIESKIGPVTKTPEEISAILLKNIKQKVEAFQGKQISKVIITVPAAFNSYQIKATHAAATLAGWEHVKLLPEPIAAAFAYFINRPFPQSSTLLLFDLGGGTLDVCIFKVVHDNIQIISRAGHSNLGGRDFDNILINYCRDKLKRDHGIIVPESKKYKLMLKCQEIKHNLTLIDEEQLDIEEFDMSKEGYIKITRDHFETMSKNLLHEINNALSSALNDLKLKANQIDKVLQVGGACRMPMIKKLLHTKFPESGHCCEEHPEEVVAVGAAYYSYYLNLRQQQKAGATGVHNKVFYQQQQSNRRFLVPLDYHIPKETKPEHLPQDPFHKS